MKVLNHTRLITIARNYILFFLTSYALAIAVNVYLHEKTDLWAQIIDPKFLGQDILSASMWIMATLFLIYFGFCCFHLFHVFKTEYLNVWDNFIEGPSESGQRKILSLSQVRYIGRDALGRFCITGNEANIVLPGKLSVSNEREILRKIKQAQLEHNL